MRVGFGFCTPPSPPRVVCVVLRVNLFYLIHPLLFCFQLRCDGDATAPDKLDALMPEFVRDNAGKAFEFMVDTVDEERKAKGMDSIQESFAGERWWWRRRTVVLL